MRKLKHASLYNQSIQKSKTNYSISIFFYIFLLQILSPRTLLRYLNI